MAAETHTLIDPRKTFGQGVTDLAASDDRVVVLSADSGLSSGFGSFRERYPDRYYEFGIQEHGTTGVAAGLDSSITRLPEEPTHRLPLRPAMLHQQPAAGQEMLS